MMNGYRAPLTPPPPPPSRYSSRPRSCTVVPHTSSFHENNCSSTSNVSYRHQASMSPILIEDSPPSPGRLVMSLSPTASECDSATPIPLLPPKYHFPKPDSPMMSNVSGHSEDMSDDVLCL